MPPKTLSEKDCWFIIGAHQAGASERQCAELSGFSKTVTHNIISNFKKMGSPHASNLSVDVLLHNQPSSNKKRKLSNQTKNSPPKRGRPRKPTEAPFFTQDIVREVLKQARTDQSNPPYNNSPSVYPLDRLDTPPTDEDSQQLDTLKVGRRRESHEEEMPLTPYSIITLDESDDDDDNDEKAIPNSWTVDEDKELLKHVLNLPVKNIKWKAVEGQFQDRHLAKMCCERWDYLKKQLMKDIQYHD